MTRSVSSLSLLENVVAFDEKRRHKQPEDGRATLVKKLPMKHCGKPPLLGQKLDILVQLYFRKIRESGGVVNTKLLCQLLVTSR